MSVTYRPFKCKVGEDVFDKESGSMRQSWNVTYKGILLPDVIFFSESFAADSVEYMNIGYEQGFSDGHTHGIVKQN